MALSTLAADTGTLVGGPAIEEDFRILKSEINALIVDLNANDDGLVDLYLVNGELSLAECEEAIELDGPIDRNDRLAVEKAERYVRYVGSFQQSGGQTNARMNDGMPVIIKPRWTFSDTEGWDWMAYNHGTGALTTGASLKMKVTHYGVWVT